MGRLNILVAGLLVVLAGCETVSDSSAVSQSRQALPTLRGSYYTVKPGETLWRIANAYGLSPQALASANRIPNNGQVSVGQQLFIPLPPETNHFVWPVRGSVSAASYGAIDIAGSPGSLVRASRTGRVAVATNRLSGWGKTVVVDHLDGYVTVYAGLDQVLVSPGVQLRQGVPVGKLGARSLHFEIRQGVSPRNALSLLPER